MKIADVVLRGNGNMLSVKRVYVFSRAHSWRSILHTALVWVFPRKQIPGEGLETSSIFGRGS